MIRILAPAFLAAVVIASSLLSSISAVGQQRAAPKQGLSAEFRRTADEALMAMDALSNVVTQPESTFTPLDAKADALASKLRRTAKNQRERDISSAMDEYEAALRAKRFLYFYGADPAGERSTDAAKPRSIIVAALKR